MQRTLPPQVDVKVANLDLARAISKRDEGQMTWTPCRRVEMTDGHATIDLGLSLHVKNVGLVHSHFRDRVAIIQQVRVQALVARNGFRHSPAVDSVDFSDHHFLP
nr:hypothetical protein Iba_chr03bCG9580 [Ipomoea batatas]